jgi:hypothetical protein
MKHDARFNEDSDQRQLLSPWIDSTDQVQNPSVESDIHTGSNSVSLCGRLPEGRTFSRNKPPVAYTYQTSASQAIVRSEAR